MSGIHYMQRCLQLASAGQGYTHPNPMVGCVIVHHNRIIGEGWHRAAGQPHAEVNAIESVSDHALLKESTLYVNLEPCAHTGKTPPCSDRIIREEIQRVVIGTVDPHSVVAGEGIRRMKEHGIDVEVGMLEDACLDLNRAFFGYHRSISGTTGRRPYITLKWAQSRDGFIAPDPKLREEGRPYWITGKQSRQLAHKLRAQVDAILIGGNTVTLDNPSLTTRDWPGRDPQRIIWSSQPIHPGREVIRDGRPTWIAGRNAAHNSYPAHVMSWNAADLPELLAELHRREILHLLVEGGAQTLNAFIDAGLWDEALVLTAPVIFESGTVAPHLTRKILIDSQLEGLDLWQTYHRL